MLFELVIFVMSRLQKIDQHFLAVRFVGTIHEEFLGFRSLERITGEAIASAILDVLPKWNLNIKNWRGSVHIVKNCDLGREHFQALGQFFTIRTSQPANNIHKLTG